MLLSSIRELKKSKTKRTVDKRINEFRALGRKPSSELFKELCFCILTANSTAERCIEVHCHVGDGFLSLPKAKLRNKLKSLGCRFHTKRTSYINEARKYKNNLRNILISKSQKEAREWLADNIKGLGFKESSHFLRNIGYDDLAIIDFHIIDILVRNKLIKKPKNLNKKTYLKIEDLLRKLAKKLGVTLAELDLYLWYLETGKILK